MARTDPPGLASPAGRRLGARARWPTRLSVEIWLHRHGWALPIAALTLLIAGVLLATQVLPAREQLGELRSRLHATRTPARTAPLPAPAARVEPGQGLRELLSASEAGPAQVRRIAGIARVHGISLPRAQYSSSRQSPSGIEHTDITFRFVSGYPQARAFVEGVLRELPNASVDRMSFERDRVQGTEAEITLRMTLWRWPQEPSTPEATR